MKKNIVSICLLTLLPFELIAAQVIDWQKWEKQAFTRAQAEDKMILLDVGMEGCTACRWMDEITYTHAEVIDLINKHFIAIAADAEAQPDVGERYSDWAWPATIFMAPDTTQVLALSGNRRPASFIPILQALIKQKANNSLKADLLAPYSVAPEPEKTALANIRDSVRAQLDSLLNEKYGGWSDSGISTATGARLEHLYLRAHMFSNTELQTLALQTTDGYIKAIDPVWGGVFVKTFHKGPNLPKRFEQLAAVPEKRISNQANALVAFSHAYHITASDKYLLAIDEVDRFLQKWMMHEDGTFYTSQEDDPPNLSDNIGTIYYWLLDSEEERLKYGVPPIDHAVYTDKNAQVIIAYAQAYEATGRQRYLDIAIRTTRSLIKSRMQSENWILQTVDSKTTNNDRRMRPLVVDKKPFLSAQAWFGSALLSLYSSSGNEEWLKRALRLANTMLIKLYDHDKGGFYTTTLDDTASIIPPRKPLEFNAKAAHFFMTYGFTAKINVSH